MINPVNACAISLFFLWKMKMANRVGRYMPTMCSCMATILVCAFWENVLSKTMGAPLITSTMTNDATKLMVAPSTNRGRVSNAG